MKTEKKTTFWEAIIPFIVMLLILAFIKLVLGVG